MPQTKNRYRGIFKTDHGTSRFPPDPNEKRCSKSFKRLQTDQEFQRDGRRQAGRFTRL